MGKKKRREGAQRSALINMEATAAKLQSLLSMPEYMMFVQSGALRGVRQKLLKISFQTIRNTVDRIPLINAIINARIDQSLPFTKYTNERGKRGYTLKKVDKPDEKLTEKDEKLIKELRGFLDQTGFKYDPDREDDFSDYLSMFMRETIVIDQVATEIQRNRKGDAIAFYLLDGAYIKRVTPDAKDSPFKKDIRFVQEIDGKIYNQYTPEDLLFDYKNKRADLRFRGWGYSPVEQCIDLITTLLFGYNYLRDQLLRDRIPKGFISVMGDIGKPQMDAIRQYWYAAMSGAGGAWNLPILPSGKEGVGMDFKNIGQSNRDMEYHKLMMFLSSVIGAVFSIDLAEIGIKADDSQSIIGESGEPRIKASRDRGLSSMLSFAEQHIQKIIRKLTTDWQFEFTGIEREDELQRVQIRKTLVETTKTINELREEDGDEPLEDDYANVVLNPQAVQIYQAAKQAEQMGGMGGEMGPGGDEGGEEGLPEEGGVPGEEMLPGGGGEEEEAAPEEDWRAAFEKSRGDERVLRIIVH